MDLAEVEKFEAPVKVLKLSEAVRAFGYTDAKSYRYCVLGCAIYGLTGMDSNDYRRSKNMRFMNYSKLASQLFRTPHHICEQAEDFCLEGRSKDFIADWLESQGY